MEIQLFDLIIFAIAVLAVVFAAKKGFASSLLETGSVLIAGIASYHFCAPVAVFVCDTFFTNVPAKLASVIARVIVFVILFIVFSIILKLASKLLSSLLDKIPLVGTANSVLGGVLGFIKAVIIIYVICTVCYLIVLSDNAENLKPVISNSYIYQFITENNPVIEFIQK